MFVPAWNADKMTCSGKCRAKSHKLLKSNTLQRTLYSRLTGPVPVPHGDRTCGARGQDPSGTPAGASARGLVLTSWQHWMQGVIGIPRSDGMAEDNNSGIRRHTYPLETLRGSAGREEKLSYNRIKIVL